MDTLLSAGIFIGTAVATALATAVLRPVLARKAMLDHPNERTSHSVPTPRGGGIAVVPVLLAAWLVGAALTGGLGAVAYAALLAAGLAIVSLLDDIRDLPPSVRLAAHLVAASLGVLTLPGEVLVFQGWLPLMIDRALTVLAWVWMINLYNFMDGIDGITAVETAAIGWGAAMLATLGLATGEAGLLGLAAAGAAAGFLVHNWHPARIFMGDVGSVPIGFLMGWIMLSLAASGQSAAALILPLYYLADATITLGRRVLKGEKVWQAHRQHAYQKATQAGLSHAQVTARIAVTNIALIGLAVMAALGQPVPALAGAVLLVALLLWHLARPNRAPVP